MQGIFSFPVKYSTVSVYTSGVYMEKPLIGWIGTGVLGRWMAHHLHVAGYRVTVYNRTPSKSEPLLSKRATWASTSAEVAKKVMYFFRWLPTPKMSKRPTGESKDCFFGSRPGQISVDMTATNPSLARELGKEASKRRCVFCDAPVRGGDIRGRETRHTSITIGTGQIEPVTLLYQPGGLR